MQNETGSKPVALPAPKPDTKEPTAAEKAARQNGGGRMFAPRDIVKRFTRDESGATAIEYGLIAALIAVVIISSVKGVGSQLSATFNTVKSSLVAA